MNTLPNLTVRYAWSDGQPTGPVYDSPHEARNSGFNKDRVGTYDLLRLFITRDGRIIHTEIVT